MNEKQKKIQKAYKLAVNSLQKMYTSEGIRVGEKHFSGHWARDNVFASLGALELGDYEIVEKVLGLYLSHQKPSGLLPFRIGDSMTFLLLRILGLKFRGRHKPRYREDKGTDYSPTDQNSLIIILFREFIRKTRKLSFLRENIKKLEKSIIWYRNQNKDSDPLIEESRYSTWADNIKKGGKVLYTNICYCHALKCLSEMFLLLGNYKKSDKYLKLHNNLKKYILKLFWNGHYFIDWIDEKRYNHFSADGNVLAIVWDIANKKQARDIEITLENFGINRYIPSLTNRPGYPTKVSSSFWLKLFGLGDYHNGLCWLWLGAVDAVAKNKAGLEKEAIEIMERISEVALKHKGFYEVYEKNGNPVNRLFYKSEKNFTWSIGLFIWACHELAIVKK